VPFFPLSSPFLYFFPFFFPRFLSPSSRFFTASFFLAIPTLLSPCLLSASTQIVTSSLFTVMLHLQCLLLSSYPSP
jgi:hypothetical protein